MMLFSCGDDKDAGISGSDASDQIPVYTPQVYNVCVHDAGAFTEGLIYADGFLYESTGLEGKSTLRKVDPASGAVLHKIDLDPEYFGEGITICNDRIIQLTWKNKTGFVYNKDTFEKIGEFSYLTEGWGLTYDGSYLIMSDGTDVLYYLSPDDYGVVKQINVTADGSPVINLNELEYIDGKIYANVWQTDRIAVIQADGEVVGWIDLAGILEQGDCINSVDLLNGIAYNAAENRMYVTGKYWCKLFEVELVP
jgi:glutamine cyclotransferase